MTQTIMLECACGNLFEKPTTRGRPPVSCPTCREARTTVKSQSVSVAPEYFNCEDCSTQFDRLVKRGTKPRFCKECAEKRKEKTHFVSNENKKLDAESTVDRLEMMLRARGTHIKQQKVTW